MKKKILFSLSLFMFAAMMAFNLQQHNQKQFDSSGISLASLEIMSTVTFAEATCTADDPGECAADVYCPGPDGTICCMGFSPKCTSGTDYVDCGFGKQECSE